MFDFLNDINYLSKRNSEEWFYFGKIDLPLPNWDQIFIELDRIYKFNLQNQSNLIEVNKHFHLGVYLENLLTNNFGLNESSNFPIFSDFLEALKESHDIRANQHYTSQMFLSLTSVESSYGRHRDEMDVWIWQLIGRSKWKIEGKSEIFEKIVGPGELIYIPRNIYHTINSIDPRASISFASENFHYEDFINNKPLK
jgi:hypothetical protein